MICDRCVYLEPLKKAVINNGRYGKCEYCEETGTCCPKEIIIKYIDSRFQEAYRSTAELSAREWNDVYECGSSTPHIFEYWEPLQDQHELGDERFVDEIVEKLGEKYGECHYVLDDGSLDYNTYEAEWQNFSHSILHESRYFNLDAKTFLDSLFNFIHIDGEVNQDLILEVTPEDTLYRARKADSYEKIKAIESDPASQLGPTPKAYATSQRMTPRGISAMYCALDRSTCLSELRPLAGDIMVSGGFSPVNTLSFLDLSSLEKLSTPNLTPFDEGFSRAMNAHVFLTKLVLKISKPNTTKDELLYLPTQLVFEYLRSKLRSKIDGIAFPSVQTGFSGQNLVIFPESTIISEPSSPSTNPTPKISFNEGSIVIHRITAVKTASDDFSGAFDFRLDWKI